jgi:hypothetical protein
MKERPILFSSPMVRSILDGWKTQTRRVVKWPKWIDTDYDKKRCSEIINSNDYRSVVKRGCCDGVIGKFGSPYGILGDRLWVRETFYAWGKWEPYLDGKKDRWRFLDHTDSKHPVKYPATEGNRFYQGPSNGGDDYHCRPSIFMPRWASRITLEVKDVQVERLQDISEADAELEGIERVGGEYSCSPWRNYLIGTPGEMNVHASAPTRSFQTLWDSINNKRGYGWDTNPWVWAVEFMMI